MPAATEPRFASDRASLVHAPGPRAVEAVLLEDLAALVHEARADPRLLARPVRVVVPSRSLRAHLGARIAGELGATAGITIQTLHALALEILERQGEDGAASDEWIEILARRRAREAPALARALGDFEDGFRGVAATVRDLVDAGLEADDEEAVLEALADTGAGRAEHTRQQALVAVAVQVLRDAEGGPGGRSRVLRRAREAFLRDPARALPTRALLVHGFGDATGRAAELLEALATRLPGRVLLDLPADPAAPDRLDLGERFVQRLRGRLEGELGPAVPAAPALAPAARVLLRAPTPETEAREALRRLAAEIASGTPPERLAIVARDLGPYRAVLRMHAARLGVPLSGLRARAPLDGAGRRLLALVDVLRGGERAPAERWLDAVTVVLARGDSPHETARRADRDLALALRQLGAAQLADVGRLDAAGRLVNDTLALPVRTGSRIGRPGERVEGFHTRRRKVHGERLAAARAAARRLLRRLERWPRRATASEHARVLARLRTRDLGWRPRDECERRARAALEPLVGALDALELSREEFAMLAVRALTAAAAPALGGRGGGVQVLDAMEARGRTFARLHLLGVTRDAFPRVVREDPLLSDTARRAIEAILPDVPIKARGRAEERLLFAQLSAAAEHVTISWPLCDDDGKRRSLSPLVERLLDGPEQDVALLPPFLPEEGEVAPPHTAAEHVLLEGLRRRRRHADDLARALAETGEADAARVAAARVKVLEAYERGPHEAVPLGPWLGFLGHAPDVPSRPDPRAETPSVTRIEALARCAWQAVLTRFLHLDATFEALDGPGAVDARAVGNLVHGFLERLARDARGEPRPGRADGPTLAEVLARAPVPVPWPDAEDFERRLLEAARDTFEGALVPPGVVRWLAERARGRLETAREILAREAEHEGGVLGVEVPGAVTVPGPDGTGFPLTFRADRVERIGERTLLTDLKTGTATSAKELTEKGIPGGTQLQALVYGIAARAHVPGARGRYLYLGEARDDPSVTVAGDLAEAERALASALATVETAWVEGVFYPRMLGARPEKPGPYCDFCSVAQACLREDSGAKLATVLWTGDDARLTGRTRGAETRAALAGLWSLAAKGASANRGARSARKGRS